MSKSHEVGDRSAAAQRPYTAAAFAAIAIGSPGVEDAALIGSEDTASLPALKPFMAERANETIVEVPASHVSFVSQPEAATQRAAHIPEVVKKVVMPRAKRLREGFLGCVSGRAFSGWCSRRRWVGRRR
jgi:hypothetical protein